MEQPKVIRELKRDELGRIELMDGPRGLLIRRVACGGVMPGSRWLARRLMARERDSLQRVSSLGGVACIVEDSAYQAAVSLDGRAPHAKDVLLRSWLDGVPLYEATELALNFFDLLDDLTRELHFQGVCHNDLHKEQNILVQADGYPALLDFQLASVHSVGTRQFEKRAREDLRHLQKHRRRYTRDGRGPEGVSEGAGHGLRRGLLARAWRRGGKPVYNMLVHGLARKGASEPRRESHEAFPIWIEELPSSRCGTQRDPASSPDSVDPAGSV